MFEAYTASVTVKAAVKECLTRGVATKGGMGRGAVTYNLGKGTRKSGDGQTSCGNSLINLSVLLHGIRAVGINSDHVYAVVLGDDLLAFMTERSAVKLSRYYSRDPFGLNYKQGDNVHFCPLRANIPGLSFCSMELVRCIGGPLGERWALCLDPERVIRKTFWSLMPGSEHWDIDKRIYYMRAVARGLLNHAAPLYAFHDLLTQMSRMDCKKPGSRFRARVDAALNEGAEWKMGTDRENGGLVPSEDAVNKWGMLNELDVPVVLAGLKADGHYDFGPSTSW
jgi:hypothetical protein